MSWKAFQRIGRFIQQRHVGVIATSTTVVFGLVIYERFKDLKIAYAAEKKPYDRFPLKQGAENDYHKTLSGPVSGIKWDENWDKRDPKLLVKPPKTSSEEDMQAYEEKVKEKTPKVTRHLILIRHGQYVNTVPLDVDRILTDLGKNQAHMSGMRLKELDLDYTHLISSTMSRAVETADIIHQYLPGLTILRDDILREGAPIAPEPKHYSWRPENYQFFQDSARIEAAFRKYFHRADPEQKGDSVEIIVCHANVIRYFVCRALQFPPEAWLRISLAHASLTHLMIRPTGRVVLKALGSAGHMPPTKVSYS